MHKNAHLFMKFLDEWIHFRGDMLVALVPLKNNLWLHLNGFLSWLKLEEKTAPKLDEK